MTIFKLICMILKAFNAESEMCRNILLHYVILLERSFTRSLCVTNFFELDLFASLS